MGLAHNPDVSNCIISKTEKGQIILQINSSLTAFKQEVVFRNGEESYKSPEEFRNLVLNYFNSSFSIVINDKDTLQFKNPKVFLGHETKLVAEITGLPKDIHTIHLKNELFKNIYKNQSIVLFLLAKLPTEKYTLSSANHHQITIQFNNGNWTELEKAEKKSLLGFIPYLIIVILASFLIYLIRKRKKNI